MVDFVTLVFAFGLGVGSFFSPCSVALIPAYVSYYVGTAPAAGTHAQRGRGALAGLRFGGASAVGVFAVFAGVGSLIYALRTYTGLSSPQLTSALAILAVAIAALVIVLGILFLLGRAPTFAPALRAPREKTVWSMAVFGAAYGLASLGCTGALFLAAIAQAILQGPVGGLLVTFAYALGLGGSLLVGAVLLSAAQERSREALRKVMPYVGPGAGVVMILGGLYVIAYYVLLVDAF
jgi:cytochrome c-type biogenesis protein